MRKIFSLVIALILTLSLIACAQQPAAIQPTPVASVPGTPAPEVESTMTPGSYEVTTKGYFGEFTLNVTVNETSLVAIDLIENKEEPPSLTAACVKELSKKMVENQTIEVDVLAGATVTSHAVRATVQTALELAGADIDNFDIDNFNKALEKAPIVAGPDETVDVLVIGGGGAGLSAALSASYENLTTPKDDVKIMLVEKLGYYGGSTAFATGSVYVTDGSDEAAQATIAAARARSGDNWLNEELLTKFAKVSADTAEKLMAMGMDVTITLGADNGLRGSFSPNITRPRLRGPGGYYHTEFLANKVMENNVDMRLNTKAEELIVENGAVVGAKITGPTSTYSVYAKKVVLATGGITYSPESIAKYIPGQEGIVPYACVGDTGDGHRMAEAVDAVVIGENMIAYPGSGSYWGIDSDLSPFHFGAPGIYVNNQGKRFTKDAGAISNYLALDLLKQPDCLAYSIIDSNHPNVDLVGKTLDVHSAWTANTLEELAALIKIPADALIETVNAYNLAYDEGRDMEFDTKNDMMLPVKTGPFHALVLRPIAIGSLVSLKVTDNCEVLNSNGDVVPNLYAVGEMCLGGNMLYVYSGSWGLGSALHTGRIAGEHARASILQ